MWTIAIINGWLDCYVYSSMLLLVSQHTQAFIFHIESLSNQEFVMAAWLAPAIKAVLPHLGTIISAVEPIFTKKKADAAANQMQLLQDQVAELQSAATQNVEYIKDLAAQLQSTLVALEQASSVAEAKIKRSLQLSAAAITLAAITLAVVVLVALT